MGNCRRDDGDDKGAYSAGGQTLKDENGDEIENKEILERWGKEGEDSTNDWNRMVAPEENE